MYVESTRNKSRNYLLRGTIGKLCIFMMQVSIFNDLLHIHSLKTILNDQYFTYGFYSLTVLLN
jgi:hypothetical protein